MIVDGVNIVKKHKKASQSNPESQIVEVFAPLNASKVAYYDEKSKKASKIGYSFDKDGKKIRVLKSTKKEIK